MKLLRCHIENFGKLSNLTLDFAEEIHVIHEENAWGKSTLAAFLKAMLYGLDAKKSAGAIEKERNLYRPWQGGVYGGQLDFEAKGREYRVIRIFGRTEKADEVHLYDLRTNLEASDFWGDTKNLDFKKYKFPKEIGEVLFGLDSLSFKRSVYIAQNDCDCETSDQINAKLGNLVDNTDDINNFESACQHLKEVLNQLTPDRVTGSIKKRKNYITQLTQEIYAYESAEAALHDVCQKELEAEARIEELLMIRKNYADALVTASEESRKKELYLQYDAICKEADEKEERKNAFSALFPNGVPKNEEFQEMLRTAHEMEAVDSAMESMELTAEEQEILAELDYMFAVQTPEEDEIDAALAMFADIDKQKEEIARQESKLTMYDSMIDSNQEMPKFEGVVGYKFFLFAGMGITAAGLIALFVWYLNLFPNMETSVLAIPAFVALICGSMFALIGLLIRNRVSQKIKLWEEAAQIQKNEQLQKRETLEHAINRMKEDVHQVYKTIGQFLETFHIECETTEYQSRLYELKNQIFEYEYLVEKEEQCGEKKAFYEELQEKVLAFVEKYGFSCGGLQNSQSSFEAECNSETVTTMSDSAEYIFDTSSLSLNISEALNEWKNKALEYQHSLAVYQEALDKKEAFEQRQEKSFWTREAMCPHTLEELNELIACSDNKLEEMKNTRDQYLKQMQDFQEQLDLRDEKKMELEELQEVQKQEMKKFEIIKLTQEYLTRAKEQFTARYMEPISRGFAKYYGMLTGDKETDWVIDANINLRVQEEGELRGIKWLSAGYQDLMGICMRLALVDTMYEKEEKPFLILDDPFVNLDEEKVAYGNLLLLSVAKEYQVIYFTCHDSRSPNGKKRVMKTL